MTPNEEAMWNDIAEAIEPYCVNGAGMIRDAVHMKAFCINMGRGANHGLWIEYNDESDEPLIKLFDVEEDLRIFHKDPPGMFEGLKLDGDEI